MFTLAHQHERAELSGLLKQESPIFTIQNTFKELMDFLGHAPESERVEQLLADFAARVGQLNGDSICLGEDKPHYKTIHAVMLLRHYGIGIRVKRRFDNALILYAQRREVKTPDEKHDEHYFSGSRLSVKRPMLQVAA